MPACTETPWVDRFVLSLTALGMPAPTDELQRLAWELYPDLCVLAPEHVAQMEWQEFAGRQH